MHGRKKNTRVFVLPPERSAQGFDIAAATFSPLELDNDGLQEKFQFYGVCAKPPGFWEGQHLANSVAPIKHSKPRFMPSRLTWGTTSLRNCTSLPQAQSKGYHLRVAII
jgi:hypothetical protein